MKKEAIGQKIECTDVCVYLSRDIYRCSQLPLYVIVLFMLYLPITCVNVVDNVVWSVMVSVCEVDCVFSVHILLIFTNVCAALVADSFQWLLYVYIIYGSSVVQSSGNHFLLVKTDVDLDSQCDL